MLIDCFPFFNEYKVLQARLCYLRDIVDYFVIVEANRTHAGVPKQFELAGNYYDHVKAVAHKIIYIPFDMPNIDFSRKPTHLDFNAPQWQAERAQRNAIKYGLQRLNLKPEDAIMISDVDEIPSITAIRDSIRFLQQGPVTFNQKQFWYNFNYKQEKPWPGTVIASGLTATTYEPQWFRDSRLRFQKKEDAGWHLSYFSGIEGIKTKLKNFAHQEYNDEKYLGDAYIKNHIRNGVELFDREDNPLIPGSETELPQIIVDMIGLDDTILYRNLDKKGSNVDITVEKSRSYNSISVILPTMWKSNVLATTLPRVLENKHVGEVIVIDNEPENCPDWFQRLKKNKKLIHLEQEENIFVNPAWNLGANTAKKQKLCIMSDDVAFNTAIFDHIVDYIVEENGVIGLNSTEVVTEGTPEFKGELKDVRLVDMDDQPFVPQYFGCLFFLHKKSYFGIPPEFRIFLGDSWLYTISKLKGKKSKWIVNFPFATSHHTTSDSTPEFKSITKNEFELSKQVFLNSKTNLEDFALSLSNKIKEGYISSTKG